MKRLPVAGQGLALALISWTLLLTVAGCGSSGSVRTIVITVTATPTPTPGPTGTLTPLPTPSATPTSDSGQYGSLLDPVEFANAPQALPPEALSEPPVPTALPTAFLADNLPAVSMQGTPGSLGSPGTCEAQSFGYGLGSFTAARNPDGSIIYDPSQPDTSTSPAYLFALVEQSEQRGCSGSEATPYLAQLIAFGAPTRQLIPYQPDCTYILGIQNQAEFPDGYPGMSQFQIGSFAAFRVDNKDSAVPLQLIKEMLVNNQVVAFSGPVLQNYSNSPSFSKDGIISPTPTIPGSGHGQLVVGYNDSLDACPKKCTIAPSGAVLVQNSFGTGWPPPGSGSTAPPGQAYWSYCTFFGTQMFAETAYPVDKSPLGGVILTASRTGAPAGSIERAFQWSAVTTSVWPQGETYFVLMHHFDAPILLQSISLTDPTGHQTARAVYNQFIRNGYTYLLRFDSKEFQPGNWSLVLQGQTVENQPISYSGTISVGDAQPNTPSPAPMSGKIRGTTMAYATITSY